MSRGGRAFDRIVVGAGIGGLAAALHAQRAGERVLVLEGAGRPGGVIRSVLRDGFRVERAAASIPSSATNLLRLVADLPSPVPLRRSVAAARPLLWRRAGLAAVPRTPVDLLRSPLLGPGAKARALSEALRAPGRGPSAETADRFVARRFGRAVAETFLRPFTSGIYGAAPERLGAADAFPGLAALERRRGSVLRGLAGARGATRREALLVEGGMERLTDALGDALGASLRLGAKVAAIEPGGADEPARVRTEDGEMLAAGEIVLAVRAREQAALLGPFAPHLASLLASVPYAPLAVIAVGWPAGRGPTLPEAFGFLRARGARGRVLGATFTSRLDPSTAPAGHDLVTVYAGGTEDPGFLDLPDDAAFALALRDLGTALGGPVRPTFLDLWRHGAAVPLFTPGHRGRMARANAEVGALRLGLLGSHVTGVGLEHCVRATAPPA
jgi:oxygen-dependent protoporphyrinogen oxidase